MPWYGWAVLSWLTITACAQFYYVDRVREPKKLVEAVWSLVELSLVGWAVVALAT